MSQNREINFVNMAQCPICMAFSEDKTVIQACADKHADPVKVAIKYTPNVKLATHFWMEFADGSHVTFQWDGFTIRPQMSIHSPADQEKYIVVWDHRQVTEEGGGESAIQFEV